MISNGRREKGLEKREPLQCLSRDSYFCDDKHEEDFLRATVFRRSESTRCPTSIVDRFARVPRGRRRPNDRSRVNREEIKEVCRPETGFFKDDAIDLELISSRFVLNEMLIRAPLITDIRVSGV